MSKKINLLVGSTGFLGNKILKELGIKNSFTIALGRRPIPNLPNSAEELIIDFSHLKSIDFSNIDHVYLSLGYPLYFHNVMGFMSSSLKKKFFQVDFNYQLEIAKKKSWFGTTLALVKYFMKSKSKKNIEKKYQLIGS